MPGLVLAALVLGSASASFVVTEGDCVVTGDCVSSPNYPESYEPYTECTIVPAIPGWLDVAGFELEHDGSWCADTDNGAVDPYGDDCGDYAVYTYWCGDGTYDDDDFSHDEMCCACGGGSGGGFCVDHLTVNDVQYCDEHGPQGVAVTDSTSITFISDYNNGGHAGFSICLASSFTGTEPPPTATPTIGPCETVSTYFSVTEGNCTACDNCFYSPNHVTGGHYHDDWHDCTITPLQSGYLDVQAFSIEESTYWGCM